MFVGGYDMLLTFLLHAGPTEGDGWSYRPAFPLGSWYTAHPTSHKSAMLVLPPLNCAATPCVRLQAVAIMVAAVYVGLHVAGFCHSQAQHTIAGL